MAARDTERAFPAAPGVEKPLVSTGLSYIDACLKHVERLGASHVYLIASGTLSRKTDLVRRLQGALGSKLVGTRTGMTPHTLISECLEVIHQVQELKVDCLITLGGGSLSDAAKVICFAEANGANTREKILALPHVMSTETIESKPSRIPFILVPTTLSGGELSRYAGVTDDEDHVKYQFSGNLQPANVVIFSGEVGATTPLDVWIASGVRSVDHCCEALVTLLPKDENWPLVVKACEEGLQNMVPGLLATVNDPDNEEARHECQLGVVPALVPLHFGVLPGASHGIGHILGPMGVVHGHTSCILMTAVHKYNRISNEKEQEFVQKTLWNIPEAANIFEEKGLKRETADLGDLLDVFVRALNMPRSLTEVGITGDEKLWQLARNTMKDPCVLANPVDLTDPKQIYEILQACK